MESSYFKMLPANLIFVFCYLLVSFEVEQTKEYIRMRCDHKLALKKIKQQILAFCLRHTSPPLSQCLTGAKML